MHVSLAPEKLEPSVIRPSHASHWPAEKIVLVHPPLSTSQACSSTFTVAADTDHLGHWAGLFKMGLALAQEVLRDSLRLLKYRHRHRPLLYPQRSCVLSTSKHIR